METLRRTERGGIENEGTRTPRMLNRKDAPRGFELAEEEKLVRH
jgi:hypothetical protein